MQFLPKNIFGRISDSFKYVFGTHHDEYEYNIDSEKAKEFKGMISAVERINKND